MSLSIGLALALLFLVTLFAFAVSYWLLKWFFWRELRAQGGGRHPIFWTVGLTAVGGSLFAQIFFGRWDFGLAVVFLAPWLVGVGSVWSAFRWRRRLENSAVPFFYALLGLLRAGLSLPTALFQLSRENHSAFASALALAIGKYESGKSIALCLARFRARTGLRRTSQFLILLEVSYAQGLPVVPLLERFVPRLEAELQLEARVSSLRRSALCQGLFAGAIPWGLGWVLHYFEPQVGGSVVLQTILVASALGMEILGGWLLWRCSTFY